MLEGDGDLLERPTAFPRVKPDRHGSAGAQRGEYEIVWGSARVGAAVGYGFVGKKFVRTDLDFLGEACCCAVNDHVRRFCLFCHVNSFSLSSSRELQPRCGPERSRTPSSPSNCRSNARAKRSLPSPSLASRS